MKLFFTFLVIALALLAGGAVTGVVGFHYPSVIQNEPLKNPQKVVRLQGGDIVLQGGQVLRIDDMDSAEISNKLSSAAFEIDLEGSKEGPVAIWARQSGWICGTPWAQPIRIPLIRDTVYKNRRQLIALGSYVQPDSQPNGAANGSQPLRSETNRTSSAAGFRR